MDYKLQPNPRFYYERVKALPYKTLLFEFHHGFKRINELSRHRSMDEVQINIAWVKPAKQIN